MTLHIADEFSRFPGPRCRNEGAHSAEQFREELLSPRFKEADSSDQILLIDLDGGFGCATAFLEEAFGGLAREFGVEPVLHRLRFKSTDEPYLEQDIRRYVRESKTGRGFGK